MTNLKTQEQLKRELSAPLPKEAISQHPTKSYLSSIKGIYITERLNNVFGIGKWSTSVNLIHMGEKGMVVVKVVFKVDDYGIYYESFGGNDNGGETSKNFDLGDAFKGATTDAIGKIGSYLGIGIDVFKGIKPSPQAPKTPPQAPPQAPPAITIDIIHVLPAIEAATTKEALKAVWEANANLHAVQAFKQAITKRKEQIL